MEAQTGLSALVAAVARGDRAALRIIYTREQRRLFGIAMAILRDRDAAADALQDAFVRLWERARSFDPTRGPAEPWLATIVRHAALDAARKRGREIPVAEPIGADVAVEPDALAALQSGEDGTRLRACLERLDPLTRQGIILAFVHGLSHPQVAARLDRPLGTVKSWIRRGLHGLRECLQ